MPQSRNYVPCLWQRIWKELRPDLQRNRCPRFQTPGPQWEIKKKRLGRDLLLSLFPDPIILSWGASFLHLILAPSEHSTYSLIGFAVLLVSQFHHLLVWINYRKAGDFLCLGLHIWKNRTTVIIILGKWINVYKGFKSPQYDKCSINAIFVVDGAVVLFPLPGIISFNKSKDHPSLFLSLSLSLTISIYIFISSL